MTRGRIAHVITESEPFGGAQRNTLLTVAGLAQEGFTSELVCGGGGRLIAEARAAGVRVHVLDSLVRPPAPARDARAFAALYRLFRARRYHVVHTHSVKAGLLGRAAAWLARVPLVVHTIHGVPFEIDGSARARVYLAYERALAPVTARLVCVGDVLRREVAGWRVVPARKLTTIYSGIDFGSYVPVTGAAALRRALALEDAWPIVGTVGRLTECKAHADLVDAMPVLLARHPRARLLLVGDGELRPRLEAQVRAAGLDGVVRLLGERDDITDLLDLFDVYAMSSRWEGVGRALTEAMYRGRPIAATPVYGVKEMIVHEQTGLVVAPRDPRAMAAAIARLADDRGLAEALGAGARAKALSLMDARRMVEAIATLYDEEYFHVRHRRQAVPAH